MTAILLPFLALLIAGTSAVVDEELLVVEDSTLNDTQASLRQSYTCGSSNVVFVNKGFQGRFATPNYPNRYSGANDCIWKLSTSSDAQFTLICDPFVVPCAGDFLIYSPSGDPSFQDASPPFCGSSKVQVTSKANHIAISFHSSLYTSGGGLSCVAQALPTAAPASTTPAPSKCDCGIKGLDRIVGGTPAGKEEWPWQVLLADISQSGGGSHYCGAALLNSEWVVTAAHCTHQRQAANIGVVVGQYNSYSLTSTSQVRRVSQIVQHPSFNRTTVNNDIALLKLASPVTLSSSARPICLPTRFANYDFNRKIATITGWGTTSYGGAPSGNLLEVSLPMMSTSACRLNPTLGSKITDNMFCTYAENKDACQGDSGGPLNWMDPDSGRTYLVGITSWGIGCAKPNVPGVYTKVTNYISWIQQYTGPLCSV